jgi:hypothetical protein
MTFQTPSKEHRATLAEAIAIGMFERGSLEISYDELLEISRKSSVFGGDIMHDLQGLSPAVVAADLQVCTFLTRTGEGVFRFSHRSFVEFFVARYLKMMVLSDKKPLMIIGRYLPREILYFWGGFAMLEPRLRERLLRWHSEGGAHGAQFSANVVGALLYSSPIQDGLALSNSEALLIDVRRVKFLSPLWVNMRFVNVDWQDVKFHNPELKGVVLRDSEVRNVIIEGGYVDLDLSEVNVRFLSADGVNLQIKSRSSRIENSKFSDSKIFISGRLRIIGCSFRAVVVEMGAYLENVDIESCEFEQSRMRFPGTVSAERVTIKGGRFEHCSFLGMVIAEAVYEKLVMSDCRGFFFCEGSWASVHFDPSCPAVEDKHQSGVLLIKSNSWLEEPVRKNLLALCERVVGKEWVDDLSKYFG